MGGVDTIERRRSIPDIIANQKAVVVFRTLWKKQIFKKIVCLLFFC